MCHKHGANNYGRPPTTGRHSTILGPLGKKYVELLSREDIKDLTPTLALMDLHIEQLIAKAIQQKDSPQWRLELREKFNALAEAYKKGQMHSTDITDLGRVINEGVAIDKALSDVVDLAERRAVRTEKVVDLDLKKDNVFTAQQFTALIALIIDVMMTEGGDRGPMLVRSLDKVLKERSGITTPMPTPGMN